MGLNLNKFGCFMKKNLVSCVLFLILMLFVGTIMYLRVQLQIKVGPFWDTYAYLANALEFAGKGTGYVELDRAPFLSFLTAIPFVMGYISANTIFWIDGFMFVFGVAGLYFFLNMRFNNLQSLSGAMLYTSFPIILSWVGVGYVDLPSTALSIWALYLTVLAVQKNPKIFCLAFPVATLAFLTRYTAGFIIFPMLLCIWMDGKYLKNFKHIIMGVILSFFITTPSLLFSYLKTGNPFYSIVWSFQFSTESLTEQFQYSPDLFYYIHHIFSYISAQGPLHFEFCGIILSIIVIGIFLYLCEILQRGMKSKYEFGSSAFRFKVILCSVFLLTFILTFTRVQYMLSEVLFFIFCYLFYNILNRLNMKNLELDALFLSWFVSQFVAVSLFTLKVDRYFISMTPAIAYFTILGVQKTSEMIKIKFRGVNIVSCILSLLIITTAFASSTIYLEDLSHGKGNYGTEDLYKTAEISKDIVESSAWLKSYDPDYHDKIIRSDVWPAFVWYLDTNMDQMSTFSSADGVNHELEKNDVTYYLSLQPDLKLKSYVKITEIGLVTIYKEDPSKVDVEPRMLYIGSGWQHYMDDVLGLKAYVLYEGVGRFTDGEFTYIDSHSLQELQQYPYILLYNFKWHDQKKTENLLMEYAENGGTVVIDASDNLDGVYYNLEDSVFLNTMITRKSLQPYPNIWINPQLGNQTVNFSPFLSDGQIWYGANYQSMNRSIENLVTVNGNTLIGVQNVGKGKIIWIGYNFVWHAFHLENTNEMGLIQQALGI